MIRDPLYILSILALLIALSEWLGRETWLRHLGSALLVIVLTAVAANIGVIPPYSDDIPVYSGIFGFVAPLSIFLLVLQVDLRRILRAGLPMIGMFLVGALGTVLGVVVGMWAIGGQEAFGAFYSALGGMFVATYIGGSVNYNAVALHYDVVREGTLYAGAAAVDSAMTTLWMVATVAIPRLLSRFGRGTPVDADAELLPEADVAAVSDVRNIEEAQTAGEVEPAHDVETTGSLEVSLLLAMGGLVVWLSGELAGWLSAWISLPSILILTTVALILAQFPWIQRLRGARLTGWLAVMLFLAVIGALCDLRALASIGQTGIDLLLFVIVVLTVHGLLIFGVGAALKIDPVLTAVASQANVGGSTSALALARSLGREEWVVPGVLVGAMGNALGTYLGFLAVGFL